MIVTQLVPSVLPHGTGRISSLILKLIITCTKGRAAALSFSPYSWLVHTQHQAWKEILSQLCLLQLPDSRNRFRVCRSHFSTVPFKKKKSGQHIMWLAYFNFSGHWMKEHSNWGSPGAPEPVWLSRASILLKKKQCIPKRQNKKMSSQGLRIAQLGKWLNDNIFMHSL